MSMLHFRSPVRVNSLIADSGRYFSESNNADTNFFVPYITLVILRMWESTSSQESRIHASGHNRGLAIIGDGTLSRTGHALHLETSCFEMTARKKVFSHDLYTSQTL